VTVRSYDQFCGLARALDVVGERWALLVIRELLISPRRYTDLHNALGGAASNLLAGRLRDLQAAGVISTRAVPAPTPARLYELTELGRQLEPAVLALTRWGAHKMLAGKRGDVFRPDWLVIAFRALLANKRSRSKSQIRFLVDDTSIRIDATPAGCTVDLGATPQANLVVKTDGATALAIVSGHLPLAGAVRSGGATVTGTKKFVQAAAALFEVDRAA
jgi:DNA-binding HxlR family transcriptional regulator